jgi:hypothetical protein
MANIIGGKYYTLPDETLVYVYGFIDGMYVYYNYAGDSGTTNGEDLTPSKLDDFPENETTDPKLPYWFDLFYDVKRPSDILRDFGDKIPDDMIDELKKIVFPGITKDSHLDQLFQIVKNKVKSKDEALRDVKIEVLEELCQELEECLVPMSKDPEHEAWASHAHGFMRCLIKQKIKRLQTENNSKFPFTNSEDEDEDEDRHSVGCYSCGNTVDERETVPNTAEYGGNDDGGELCKNCQKKLD